MLDPVAFSRHRAGGGAPPGHNPGAGQITLLAEVGPQYPDVEVLPRHPAQPAFQHPERRVNGDGLVVVGWRARADRTGVAPILPEERSNTTPVAGREPLGISVQKLVDRILIPPGPAGGTVLYPAPQTCQEAEPEDRQTPSAQTVRWCVSRTWARSS
jgi:hypothetical protein